MNEAQLREVLGEPTELVKAKEYTKGRLKLGLESTNAMASDVRLNQSTRACLGVGGGKFILFRLTS